MGSGNGNARRTQSIIFDADNEALEDDQPTAKSAVLENTSGVADFHHVLVTEEQKRAYGIPSARNKNHFGGTSKRSASVSVRKSSQIDQDMVERIRALQNKKSGAGSQSSHSGGKSGKGQGVFGGHPPAGHHGTRGR